MVLICTANIVQDENTYDIISRHKVTQLCMELSCIEAVILTFICTANDKEDENHGCRVFKWGVQY